MSCIDANATVQVQRQCEQQLQSTPLRQAGRRPLVCKAGNDKQSNRAASLASKFNPVYVGITGEHSEQLRWHESTAIMMLCLPPVLGTTAVVSAEV